MGFNKLLNSKIIWYILLGIVIILLIILVSIPKKREVINNDDNGGDIVENQDEVKYTFELKGGAIITINEGEEYIEKGFIAFSSENDNLNDMVKISGIVNTEKTGTYKLKYKLKVDDYNKELVRTVVVKERKKNEFTMNLIGDETIYLEKDEEYTELGVKAYLNGVDVSSSVSIVSYVENEAGNYIVDYFYEVDNNIKKITRQVIVLDIDSYFSVNSETKTIEVKTDDNIKYIKTPDGVVSSNKVVSYQVTSNGMYTFILYDNNFNEYDKFITIDFIKEEVPEIIVIPPIVVEPSKYTIFVGDSRTNGMCTYLKSEMESTEKCVAKDSQSLKWFQNTAISEVDKILNNNSSKKYNIIIDLGVNGISASGGKNYADTYNELKNGKWSKHNVIVTSVTPIDEARYRSRYGSGKTNAIIKSFNNNLKNNLNSNIVYCDIYNDVLTLIKDSKNIEPDGLHYTKSGSREIYKLKKACIK